MTCQKNCFQNIPSASLSPVGDRIDLLPPSDACFTTAVEYAVFVIVNHVPVSGHCRNHIIRFPDRHIMMLETITECKWGNGPWAQGLKNWFKELSPLFHLLCQADGLVTTGTGLNWHPVSQCPAARYSVARTSHFLCANRRKSSWREPLWMACADWVKCTLRTAFLILSSPTSRGNSRVTDEKGASTPLNQCSDVQGGEFTENFITGFVDAHATHVAGGRRRGKDKR